MGTFVENVNKIAVGIQDVFDNLPEILEADNNAAICTAMAEVCTSTYDQFDDRYLGPKATPPLVDNDGNALVYGTLYFDTTQNFMKVWSNAGWINAGSSVNGTTERYTYTATAGQTVFAATYEAGYIDVFLNGSKLQNGVDFTAVTATDITLASPASLGDVVDIICYAVFELSTAPTKDVVAYTVSTVADLASVPSSYTTAIVKDLNRGGTFIWSSTGAADDGTVFAGTTGYWNRQYSGAVNVRWFGAKGDGVADDTLAIQNAMDSYQNVFIPIGTYSISATLLVRRYNCRISGETMNATRLVAKVGFTGDFIILQDALAILWGKSGGIDNIILDCNSVTGGVDAFRVYDGLNLIDVQVLNVKSDRYGMRLGRPSEDSQNLYMRNVFLTGTTVTPTVSTLSIEGVNEAQLDSVKVFGKDWSSYDLVDVGQIPCLNIIDALQHVYTNLYVATSSGINIESVTLGRPTQGILFNSVTFEKTSHKIKTLGLASTSGVNGVVVLGFRVEPASAGGITIGDYTYGSDINIGRNGLTVTMGALSGSNVVTGFAGISNITSSSTSNTVILRSSSSEESNIINQTLKISKSLYPRLRLFETQGNTYKDIVWEKNGATDTGITIDTLSIRTFGIRPTTDGTIDIGGVSNKWKDGYIKNIRPGAGTTIWTSGSGSPESVLTAVVGSMYTRTDGGTGTTLYIKETGTGNTGWVAK